MRKLSVFYEHILQACEQSGKTIPEVLAFCREQGISAGEHQKERSLPRCFPMRGW